MTNEGAKRLAAAIVLQALNDLDDLYKRCMKIRKKCVKGELDKYILEAKEKAVKKNNRSIIDNLPFKTVDDYTALNFFSPSYKWGRLLLEACGITSYPLSLKERIMTAEGYERYCKRYVANKERLSAKRIKDIDL